MGVCRRALPQFLAVGCKNLVLLGKFRIASIWCMITELHTMINFRAHSYQLSILFSFAFRLWIDYRISNDSHTSCARWKWPWTKRRGISIDKRRNLMVEYVICFEYWFINNYFDLTNGFEVCASKQIESMRARPHFNKFNGALNMKNLTLMIIKSKQFKCCLNR